MSEKRRKYTKEFKKDAVELFKAGQYKIPLSFMLFMGCLLVL